MGITQTSFLIGIDGGGTGCRVAICARDGARLAEAKGGPANYTTAPADTLANIRAALAEAATMAAISKPDLARASVHVGLAGVLTPADADAVAGALEAAHVTATDDRATSVAGALGARDGILAAIGTGTIIAARQGDTLRHFGGWGHRLSDQSSGAWLGLRALRIAIRAHDGLVARSALTDALLDRYGTPPVGAVQFAARAEPGDFAALAPRIIEAATQGDIHARALLQDGADYLQACIAAAALPDDAVLCLAGGIGPYYRPYLPPALQARIQAPQGTALDGALRLARDHADKPERSS